MRCPTPHSTCKPHINKAALSRSEVRGYSLLDASARRSLRWAFVPRFRVPAIYGRALPDGVR
jgi:hypothetical protein